jgi:hypothetical protein
MDLGHTFSKGSLKTTILRSLVVSEFNATPIWIEQNNRVVSRVRVKPQVRRNKYAAIRRALHVPR